MQAGGWAGRQMGRQADGRAGRQAGGWVGSYVCRFVIMFTSLALEGVHKRLSLYEVLTCSQGESINKIMA